MIYSNWFPLDCNHFRPSLDEQRNLSSMLVRMEHTGTVIAVRSDSEELLDYCRRYLIPAPDDTVPDCSLSFLLDTPVPMLTPHGLDHVRRTPEFPYYDAAVDIQRQHVLYAGLRHYGLLKSIVAGLHSFHHASDCQQGVHAAAMRLGKRGILLAGGAGSGKTGVFLRLLNAATAVVTDDWCDVAVTANNELFATGGEGNISFNVKDVAPLVDSGLLPSGFARLPAIPHGHRDKVVDRLSAVCPGKTTDIIQITSLYLLDEVDAPVVVRSPPPEWLDQRLAAISTHMPFCYPPDGIPPVFRWGEAGHVKGCEASVRAATSAIGRHREFCARLADVISDGRCRLTLLPASQAVSFDEKVSTILRQELFA
jgi:hypothetical protein